VTQRRNPSGGPRELLADDGIWPDNPKTPPGLAVGIANACVAAAKIASRLERSVQGRNISSIARDADVARSTVYDVIRGDSWPDVITVFKLQETLGVRLWGIR
jgi:predicted transcriptional regulator